mmetsp:Transcript_31494/g.102622  ORF Transcript_31494/g.102622 Transcript_31494/m.102622 type:complete len:95 (+) Transcript_31494:584-868(+)
MLNKNLTFRKAYDQVVSARREAAPNPAFVEALVALDAKLHNTSPEASAPTAARRKAQKPKPQTCRHCGAVVGISVESLRLHESRCNAATNDSAA